MIAALIFFFTLALLLERILTEDIYEEFLRTPPSEVHFVEDTFEGDYANITSEDGESAWSTYHWQLLGWHDSWDTEDILRLLKSWPVRIGPVTFTAQKKAASPRWRPILIRDEA